MKNRKAVIQKSGRGRLREAPAVVDFLWGNFSALDRRSRDNRT